MKPDPAMPSPWSATPVVSVIVVTHNHAAPLGDCLASVVRAATELPTELIVVDNRSDDASARLAAACPGVRLHVNTARRGYAANNNVGMALARGRYLLVLNPDTIVQPGALPALVAFMDAHPRVGLCGPLLTYPDGRPQPSARRFPTPAVALARRSPWRRFLRDTRANRRHLMLDDDLGAPRAVDWLLGACLMLRRETVEAIGPFDEGYRLYVEDIDFGRRLQRAGWGVSLVPAACVVHVHQGASDKRLLSRAAWWHLCSMLRYARKFMLPRVPGLSIRGERLTCWETARGLVTAGRPLDL